VNSIAWESVRKVEMVEGTDNQAASGE